MTSPVIQFKRGDFVNLPPLQAGEPALTLDTFEFYIGINSTTEGNKFFGSHRYWSREDVGKGSGVNLVEATGGSNYITLASPSTLAGITTYTFPATPEDGYFLKTNANGTLEWGNVSAGASFTSSYLDSTVLTGISTFEGAVEILDDTQSTDKDTGALIVEGGVGIEKNLNVGGDLKVTGVSTFVGNVTFEGGTINLGDSATDNINVVGEFISNLVPNDDDTYDVGIGTQRWRNANFSGIVTTTDLNVTGDATLGDGSGDELTINATTTFNAPVVFEGGITGNISTATRSSSVDTTETGTDAEFYPTFVSISTTTDAQTVRTDGDISYNPDTNTLTVPNLKTEDIKHSTGTQAIAIDFSGNVGLSSNLTVSGNLFVNGSTTQINVETLRVKDSLIDLAKIDDGSGNLVPPTEDLNIDVGLLLNYYTNSAKKAAVYWDDSVSRIGIASDVSETNNVLTANAYAALEIGSLWINDCVGQSEVISCADGVRKLGNITIDAGTF